MLSLTPEVMKGLDWFQWTHEITDHGWRRRALPRDGGVAKQPARLMLMLDVMLHAANELLTERMERSRKSRDITEWRAQRAERLRNA